MTTNQIAEATITLSAAAGTVTAVVTADGIAPRTFSTKDGGRFITRLDRQMKDSNVLRTGGYDNAPASTMTAAGWVLL